jgi:hypothetical protein
VTDADRLLAECRCRSVTVTAAGSRLHYRGPAGAIDPELLARLAAHKPDLLATLSRPACAGCGCCLDAARRCWACCDRPCVDCGRPTGSAFIQR